MSNLVKQVDFYGDKLAAIKNQETEKIYVGISYVCKGIGLNKSQKDTQVQNVQNDLVLKQGCLKFQAGVFDQNNSTIAIDINYLPLWLAKISITPTMQNEQPEIAGKLINYQLKAKDVLAAAFINKQPQCVEDLIIMQAQSLKDIRLQLQETKQETVAVKEEVQAMKDVITIKPSEEWRKKTNVLINRICMKTKDYKNTKDEIYKALQERAGCDLKIRLKNMRGRLLLNGATQSKVDNMNYLDVIAEDKKLIEIYTAIVKELAVKNSIEVKEVV